ncbi:pyrimidine reductase [Actinocatenispora thailandica]|uniref:Pyrimidine reductase n=1 Tax=Actinocatenispora thailandica TaxID=227318 RepID=A0A7R7DKB4_9ACTN|nr:dihydrofolate reductase family protein [Actinocatenispora thailandica]BCJ33310.1 pyrimidine reductase [Actinocatenispora thailandica]
MARIVISENVSVDGVVEVGDGFDRGDWYGRIGATDREAWAKLEYDEALGADALLLGRRTYEWFGARGWPSRSGAWADRLRELPKYVVAGETDLGRWANSTVLTGPVTEAVTALKREVRGEIVVYGSGRLARALLAAELVDELRLVTYPFVVGAGERLFGATDAVRSLGLADTRTVGENLALLTYRPA